MPASASIRIRPALASDAPLAAQVFSLSMGGLADHLFGHGEQVFRSVIEGLFKRNAGRFGYKQSVVAELDGQPRGMLFSYSGAQLVRLNIESFRHFFPVMGFKRALNFMLRGIQLPGGIEAARDEYYISNLGILPAAQGQGVGSQLLDYAEKLAKAGSLCQCSLIVGLSNVNALRLYQRTGYEIVETVNDQNKNLGYHRMVKQLS
ncbi:MAG: GNAT family N-acetyltransferase [Chloroflexi bacterium]|nr:GNAT family N-acetyltransferase [Chloroflexota bacterium]